MNAEVESGVWEAPKCADAVERVYESRAKKRPLQLGRKSENPNPKS